MTIFSREAEVCCSNCGQVMEDRLIDMAPEHRTFASDMENGKQDLSHAGAPERMGIRYDTSLGCSTDKSTSIGRQIAYAQRFVEKEAPPRVLTRVMAEYDKITDSLHVSEHLRTLADEMYVEYCSQKRMGSKKSKAAYAACIYYAGNTGHAKLGVKQVGEAFAIQDKFGAMVNLVQKTLIIGKFTEIFSNSGTDNDGEKWVTPMVLCQHGIAELKKQTVVIECRKIWNVLKAQQVC